MKNALLAFPNRADECTLTNGSWAATLPLNNLKNRILRKVARTTDATLASTKVDAALTKPRPVKVFAAINHNLSIDAKYRLRGSLVADFSTVAFDSGWVDVWPVIYPFGTVEWEDDRFWEGKPTAEERAGYTANLIIVMAAPVYGRYWRLEMDDTANAASYVQVGRLFMASQWQPATNMSYGGKLGYEDPTQIETALDGTEYFDERPKYRVTDIAFDYMSHDEAHANALEAQRQLGISKELLLVPDADDTTHMMRRAYLGRLERLSPIEKYRCYNTNRTVFRVKEIV